MAGFARPGMLGKRVKLKDMIKEIRIVFYLLVLVAVTAINGTFLETKDCSVMRCWQYETIVML